MLPSKVLQLHDLFTQMPLFLTNKINKVSTYAVWNITETATELARLAGSSAPHKNDKKKCEWLATRLLVMHLASLFEISYAGIAKTTSRKAFPHRPCGKHFNNTLFSYGCCHDSFGCALWY